jgi:hypothetical protein
MTGTPDGHPPLGPGTAMEFGWFVGQVHAYLSCVEIVGQLRGIPNGRWFLTPIPRSQRVADSLL